MYCRGRDTNLKKQHQMNQIKINNENQMSRVVMAAGLEQEILRHAWLEVSRKRPLTAEHLERYEQSLAWDEVSQNQQIEWTVDMARRWKDKLNWKLLSRTAHGEAFTPEGIAALADLWDWKELTVNPNVRMTVEFAENYCTKWDWSAMAWRSWEGYDAREFYGHFLERIPRTAFNGSKLHFALRLQEVERLWQEMNKQ